MIRVTHEGVWIDGVLLPTAEFDWARLEDGRTEVSVTLSERSENVEIEPPMVEERCRTCGQPVGLVGQPPVTVIGPEDTAHREPFPEPVIRREPDYPGSKYTRMFAACPVCDKRIAGWVEDAERRLYQPCNHDAGEVKG